MRQKLERGKPLEELVKGSLNYTMNQIWVAFRAALSGADGEYAYWIEEYFEGYLIVKGPGLGPDEFYRVPFSTDVSGKYVFAAREDWDVVELAYQPQTRSIGESARGKKTRLVERLGTIQLLEAQAGAPRKIKAIGITADVTNGNGRRYPAPVLKAAVDEVRNHLHESAGQGRLMLLGEAEHPSDKGGRPNLLETVVRWDDIQFEDNQVVLDGHVLETTKGRDILALMEGGVMPGVSQRAYGKSRFTRDGSERVEEVAELHITGYDLVIEPSDPNAAITSISESLQEEEDMDLEELVKLVQKNPEVFRGVVAEEVRKMNAQQLAALEETVRAKLGVDAGADLGKALEEAVAAKKQLEAQERQAEIEAAIVEQTKNLAYGSALNQAFVEAVKAAKPESAEAVKALVEAKRKEYDQISSQARLNGMGLQILGSVLERETGNPEFARAAFELTEAIRKVDLSPMRNLAQPKNLNEEFTAQYLKKFDQQYRGHLLREAQMFAEAEQTTDLNLPYSVARAVIAEAFPRLVASGIFDFGLTDQSPTKIFYESFSGETGYTGTVTDEDATADLNGWVQLAHNRITPGTMVVTNTAGSTTYPEGSAYVVDYANGKLMALATITDEQALKVDYSYTAVRKGEMAAIERGKMGLSSKTLEIAADRLATQISREAVMFSRSQLGWDATARTLSSLVRQVQRKIDQGAIYMALAAALRVSSNSGGTWTAASDTLDTLVKYIGAAKVKVGNRYYEPTFILVSLTNSDRIGNWDGFTAAGKRPDSDINANGYIGRIKGLAAFESTEMSDGYLLIGNRELVMHRVFSAMQLHGPFPTYDNGKLVAADQYYAEEFNGSDAPVPEKGAYVKIG